MTFPYNFSEMLDPNLHFYNIGSDTQPWLRYLVRWRSSRRGRIRRQRGRPPDQCEQSAGAARDGAPHLQSINVCQHVFNQSINWPQVLHANDALLLLSINAYVIIWFQSKINLCCCCSWWCSPTAINQFSRDGVLLLQSINIYLYMTLINQQSAGAARDGALLLQSINVYQHVFNQSIKLTAGPSRDGALLLQSINMCPAVLRIRIRDHMFSLNQLLVLSSSILSILCQ